MASSISETAESINLYQYVTDTGIIIPQTSDIKGKVSEMMKSIFSSDLDTSDETPAGRLVEAITLLCVQFLGITAQNANQINPNYATGQALDAIGSIFECKRSDATQTIITLMCYGSGGTTIKAGSIVSDNDGNKFTVNSDVTIQEGSSSAIAYGYCQAEGNIEPTIGAVKNIDESITTGVWLTVSNTAQESTGTVTSPSKLTMTLTGHYNCTAKAGTVFRNSSDNLNYILDNDVTFTDSSASTSLITATGSATCTQYGAFTPANNSINVIKTFKNDLPWTSLKWKETYQSGTSSRREKIKLTINKKNNACGYTLKAGATFTCSAVQGRIYTLESDLVVGTSTTATGTLVCNVYGSYSHVNTEEYTITDVNSTSCVTGIISTATNTAQINTGTADTFTKIVITCAGKAGTTVLAGSVISDGTYEYVIDDDILIGGTLTGPGTATCKTAGAITPTVHTVTQIVENSTKGNWESVTNIDIDTPGVDIESDANYRRRILESRWTGTAYLNAIRSALEQLDGYQSMLLWENGTNATRYLYKDANGVITETADESVVTSIPHLEIDPHAIILVYNGTTPYDAIAQALYESKSAGCGLTAISSTIASGLSQTGYAVDPATNRSYAMTFNIPQALAIDVAVTVSKNNYTGSTADLQSAVSNAITNWANNKVDNVEGLELGRDVYGYEVGAAISDQIPEIKIKTVTFSYTPAGGSATSGAAVASVACYQMPRIGTKTITVI